MWRGDCSSDATVSAPFVWRCLNCQSMTPFPHPAHRTGLADFPHPALGQELMPSPTAGGVPSHQAGPSPACDAEPHWGSVHIPHFAPCAWHTATDVTYDARA